MGKFLNPALLSVARHIATLQILLDIAYTFSMKRLHIYLVNDNISEPESRINYTSNIYPTS
jgi:hypothetical protein